VLKLLNTLDGLESATLADVTLPGQANKPSVKRGTMVLAVGHNLAASSADGLPSASWGIVSNTSQRSSPQAKDSSIQLPSKTMHSQGGLLQTDARVALGCSGAGLFHLNGELIGLATSLAAVSGSEATGGYAIPMDRHYRKLIDVLREGREIEYGFLGIAKDSRFGGRMEAEPKRVYVGGMPSNSPARAAGLQEGDELLNVDGVRLREWDDLLLTVAAAQAGNEVQITFQRNGRPGTSVARVLLGKTANPMAFIASAPAPTPFGLQVDYVSTKFAVVFGGNAQESVLPTGVLLKDVAPKSAAERAMKNIEPPRGFWVITQVNDTPVSLPRDFYKAVTGRESVKLHLADSQDQLRRIIVPIP